jgi:hypothetical protein
MPIFWAGSKDLYARLPCRPGIQSFLVGGAWSFKFDIDADNDARDSPFAADKSAGGPHRRE